MQEFPGQLRLISPGLYIQEDEPLRTGDEQISSARDILLSLKDGRFQSGDFADCCIILNTNDLHRWVFIKFIEFNRKFVWAAMGIFHDQQVDGRGNPDPMQKLANLR